MDEQAYSRYLAKSRAGPFVSWRCRLIPIMRRCFRRLADGHVDIAGSIPALHRAKGRVVTVAVNSFQFKQPGSSETS